MKKFLITTSVLIASILLMITCTKSEEASKNSVEEGKEALVTLSLAGTLPASRAIGGIPDQTADNTINKIMVFMFNTGNGQIDRVKTATAGEIASKNVSITGTSGTRDIYVVTNYPPADSTNLKNVTTVAELKAITADLKNEAPNNFRMIGKKTSVAINPGSNNLTIYVSRLVARVLLTNITTNFTGGLASKNLTIDSVYLLNVIGTKSYQDSSFIVTPATIYNRAATGLAVPIFDVTSAAINNTTPYTSTAGNANGNHYYVYANNGASFVNATKLVITGMLNGARTYYPIAINVLGNNYTPVNPGIVANTQYSISVSISGFGSLSPEVPVQSATLAITVTPLNWGTTITQSVTF